MNSPITASYFDGRTSRAHPVTVTIADGSILVSSEQVNRREPATQALILERYRNTPRSVMFDDGAMLEVQDNAAFDSLLFQSGYREAPVVAWQRSWRIAVLCVVVLAALGFFGYRSGLPPAASYVADRLPDDVGRQITLQSLRIADGHWLHRSRLAEERQKAISERFAKLLEKGGASPNGTLLFRSGPAIGPNAFTLPDGTIVLLDELVSIVGDDEEVLAVLAHEAGHAHYKHSLRAMLQGAAIGIAMFAWIGDTNWLVASLPAAALNAKYSRAFESDADRYGADLLRASGIPPVRLAEVFERLEEYVRRRTGEDQAQDVGSFLDSHPTTRERIEALRQLR